MSKKGAFRLNLALTDHPWAWKEDRQGAIVGDALAKKMGWKVGDKVPITSQIFRGDWEFHISGIYTATKQSVDRSTVLFHWGYLNDAALTRQKDQVGWMIIRVDDPNKTAEIGRGIDKIFSRRLLPGSAAATHTGAGPAHDA